MDERKDIAQMQGEINKIFEDNGMHDDMAVSDEMARYEAEEVKMKMSKQDVGI